MFTLQKKIMGTEIEILIPRNQDGFSESRALTVSEKVFQNFCILEKIFSRFDTTSELSLLNTQRKAKVSQEFLKILEFSLQIAEKTDGVFNPLVRLSALGYSQDFWSKEFPIPSAKKISLDFRSIYIDTNTSEVSLPENAFSVSSSSKLFKILPFKDFSQARRKI